MSTPVAGFTSPEVFDSKLTFGVFLRRFMLTLVSVPVVTFLLLGVLLQGLFGLFGVRWLGWLVALVVCAMGAVGMVVSKKRQFDETWGTTRLELSAAGVTMASRYALVQLPWGHIHHLGTATLVAPQRTTVHGAGVGGPVGRGALVGSLLSFLLIRTVGDRRQPALVGVGTTAIAPDTSKLVRGQIWQNDSCREFDAVTRRRMTAIVLPVYDRDWRNGRIGEWIGAHRPDLLEPSPTRQS